MKKICLFMLQLTVLLVLCGCISTAHFQSWSGPTEFEGHGGSFTTQDGIDVYSVGAPNRKCHILGTVTASTVSRAYLMALYGNSWSTSSLVKEAKTRGGNAIILVDNNSQKWLTGSTDANGRGQIHTDESLDQRAVLVKYVGDAQEQSQPAEIKTK